MSETPQLYLGLEAESGEAATGFQGVLNYIREVAPTEYHKGYEFERLMKQYLSIDPLYKERFTDVYLWKEWAALRTDFDATDIGVDLVARESSGEYCAIQCKCYAENTRVTKPHIDSFISASESKIFTKRMLIHTAGGLNSNAERIINPLGADFQVIGYGQLASRPIDWPDLRQEAPEQLDYRPEQFSLRPHQQEAFDDVINGFKESDRGKLIMACGTGKTFTSLKIAEEIGGVGGRVLYLVPSIALLSQAMREWAEQRGVKHRYIGICSDTHAGRTGDDTSIYELEIPPTTDTVEISEVLQKNDQDTMTVIFCTYQSLPIVADAQAQGASAFDLVLCDEAHRTTGVDKPGDKTSPFVLVHDAEQIHAEKRLYMTATPRLYAEGAKAKAASHNRGVFSMDDPAIYGDEFHRLPFSRAVEIGELSDYKVAILTIYESDQAGALQEYAKAGGTEINITDATKIVGCWRALQNPEGKSDDDETINPLTRVISFNNTIRNSKRITEHWNRVIANAIEQMPHDRRPANFACEVDHVDGTDNAFVRKTKIDWLKGEKDGVCRILSNARCLSEGVDVPALDAVIFMTPRSSYVDIVQAVGRVMRKSEGKENGYIILPVAIPPGTDPADALNNNDRFATVWNVLNALRSHDDRFNNEINKIDLNNTRPDRIIGPIVNGDPDESEQAWQEWIDFGLVEIPADALYAKIVERCGDRRYWESWAKDVADIFSRLVERIKNLLDNPENDALLEWFDAFHEELKKTINESIGQNDAVDMMAQHILTRPVFEALFEGYDFAEGNPVSIALDRLWNDFGEFGLEEETRDLERFYDTVRTRAQGIDNSEGRQSVLLELYEKFFKIATKKDADRLGIVYTPVEVVDFILHSANEALREEFGRSLSDEGVHIIDPFVGTGTFFARLLQSDLIDPSDLERKYQEELHANEIVLLAYYIAAVNIEETFRWRRGADSGYKSFNGIVLTDTFNLNKKGEERTLFPKEWLPVNNVRAEHQQKLPIQVIVGNPPWSAGQKSATDETPNVSYPALENRIEETYASRSATTLKRHLYDTYKMAIRWASDRIGDQGVIAFVTNGSWIDGNTDAGIRASLAEEFSSIHVFNLRGDQRTQGEQSHREGGKIFGSGSRAPVAITIMVKNPNAAHNGCRIRYRDIGDYLDREEKLAILRETGSILGFSDWQEITPDEHYDWIRYRSDVFAQFYPMGSEEAKAGRVDDAIFGLYSLGLATGRDPYIYNFSHDNCAENARKMTQDYLAALSAIEENPEITVNEAVHLNSSNLKWSPELKKKLARKIQTNFEERYVRKAMYRPFVPTNCYTDATFIMRKGQMDRILPDSSSANRVICVPGKGLKSPFSVFMTDMMTDLQLMFNGRCFPRHRYLKPVDASKATNPLPRIKEAPSCTDNISDTALNAFREHYSDKTITKDAIFDYVYGVLHAPSYREEFANDLSKDLPRIPFAPDFHTFAEAGKALAELHLGYETCEQYPLEVIFVHKGEPQPHHYQLTEKAMRLVDDGATLVINDHISLSGIPAEAHRYVVNGRTPLGWFIDRYQKKQDSESGIVNDPNGWFAEPHEIVEAINRIVHVSVESTRIIEGLPARLNK